MLKVYFSNPLIHLTNITMKEKIENIEKVFIVVRRKSKIVRTETGIEDLSGAKILMVFPNRKNAQTYVNYWMNGEKLYDILERKLA